MFESNIDEPIFSRIELDLVEGIQRERVLY